MVLWRDALKEHGIAAFEEFDKLVVLEMEDGDLLPIVPDRRGRAFFQDKRLRNRNVDLVGYRRRRTSTFQVLSVFIRNKMNERRYTDDSCDICSIPTYEVKPYDCCQADIRVRYQTRDLPKYITHPKAADNQWWFRTVYCGDWTAATGLRRLDCGDWKPLPLWRPAYSRLVCRR